MSDHRQRRSARRACWRFPDVCVICGGAIVGDRSADHLAPVVVARGARGAHGLGLIYPAHVACNQARGHDVATPDMIARAAAMLAGLGVEDLLAGVRNIGAMEAALRAHADALAALRRETLAAVEREVAGAGAADVRAAE
jgi:hypothetical protein